MSFIGIDAVTYGVGNMDTARRFFTDWGLRRVSSGKTRTVFETQAKCQVILRPRGAAGLPKAIQRGNTLVEAIWGVSAKRDLVAIARELSADRDVTVDRDGTVHSTDPMGLGIAFRRSRRKPVKAARTPINTPGAAERIDAQSDFHDKANPIRIGHMVFNVPDLGAMVDFYTKRLGFHISDRYVGHGVFMRCAATGNHHNLFLLQSPDGKAALNHVAFEVRDIHEVFGGGLNVTRRGWKTEIGPGRHPASSAYFWYFKNPCGGAIEYFADEDFLTPKWKPRGIKVSPENFAEWALPDGIRRFGGDIKG
jgi:catechol 2,3-dioxygenase-like lactoylglutathione lyase family enzyme